LPIGPFPDFDACVAHMTKPKSEGGGGYDEETARKVCGKMKAELEESFSWAGDIRPYPGARLIRGEAIHPVKTFHPLEWPQLRVFLEDELQKSAETLVGKPLFLDHWRPLSGKVLGARYEDGALEYVAELNDEDILRLIRDGQIKHASVQFEWKILEQVDGIAPRGLNFQHLSLLKDMEPGDPRSTVELWESIARQLKEAKGLAPPNPQTGSETEDKMKMEPLKERVWDRAYINDLSDDSFALIQSGGEKDETGKTKPRSLRWLPHHRADGSLDLPHLRNANSRAPQMKDVSEEERNAAKAHLDRHKKAAGIGEFAEAQREPYKHAWKEQNEVEFQVASEPTMDELIESIEDIVEQINARLDAVEAHLPKEQTPSELEEAEKTIDALKAQIEVLTQQKATLQEELEKAKKLGEAIIPSAVTPPSDILKEITRLLPERPPMAWGHHYHELWRNLRNLVKKHESQS